MLNRDWPLSASLCLASLPCVSALREGLRRAHVLGEEPLHGLVELETVLLVMEAVPLVLLENVLDVDAALLERRNHLVGLLDVDAWVLGALRDQERRADLVGVQRGRDCLEQRLVLFGVSD